MKPLVYGKRISQTHGIVFIDTSTNRIVSIKSWDDQPEIAFPYSASISEITAMFPQYQIEFLERPTRELESTASESQEYKALVEKMLGDIKQPPKTKSHDPIARLEQYIDRLRFATKTASKKNAALLQRKLEAAEEILAELLKN